ncbi:MAG: hypothetical protein ACRDLK_02110 [Gaiellaceae bacterium]
MRAAPQLGSRRMVLIVAAVSALVPGIVHLRLGAVADGIVFLAVLALLNAAQFGAPFLDPDAATSGVVVAAAFALGFPLSALAARSAARLAASR